MIMQYIVALLREQLQEYHYTGVTLQEKHCSVVTQDRVIDENLSMKTKKPNFVYLKIIPTNLNFSIY